MTQALTWNCASVLAWSTKYLGDHHSETPRLDAELIMAHCMGLNRIELYTHHDRPLEEDERAAIRQLLRRRVSGEPIAYILGEKSFWKNSFLVDTSSLIPRPDTELLVERALALQESLGLNARILEVGVGSGCVAISIKESWPESQFEAWDISEDALAITAKNCERIGISGLSLKKKDGRSVESYSEASFDLFVSNPPYITDADFLTLARGVKDFEPELALRGGFDGLDFYRDMAAGVSKTLRDGGIALLEIGVGQETAVVDIFKKVGLRKRMFWQDLSRRIRVIEFERAEN